MLNLPKTPSSPAHEPSIVGQRWLLRHAAQPPSVVTLELSGFP
jgi:hypothetical protein